MFDQPIIQGPLVWDGSLKNSSELFTMVISKEDHSEIDCALQTFKSNEVCPSNFPLPKLQKRLQRAKEEIHSGVGFFVIRGIEQSKYSAEDSVVIYLGIARYIGDRLGFQDRDGNVLCHVTDSRAWTVPKELRHGIHSNSSLPFHNDMGCDILCLQVRQSALSGGGTYLVSGATIFNDLVQSKPDVIQTLFERKWPVQISGQKGNYILAPLMKFHDGKLMTNVDPGRLGPHQSPAAKTSDVPSLTEPQKLALGALMECAKRHELSVPLNTGDILFVNNWAIMHRRDSYDDDADSSRHLVRLWLRDSQMAWAVPEDMKMAWKAAYERREEDGIYAIHPMPEYKAPRYTAGSAAFMIEDSDVE
ncbi:hypothetical protein jhhlp_002818 [Lomentospora prolificans]|uniref:TauD/TfdA-like domain-containing protein n=1 Tax=Lomentospora prolificans TaxID=41688 RepID=A0A2N3NF89_9PEZI|nr:hypothetical protein jhhlp_002818 [Lomentospora prolificans]